MVIKAPPSLDGAVNETVACPSPETTPVIVGASGTVAGVTKVDTPLAILVPMALVAVTVKA